jgi:ABC-2 type transport system permease protein
VSGRRLIGLVAARELRVRTREKGFWISLAVSLTIIALVAVLPGALGLGGEDHYEVAARGALATAVAAAATRLDDGYDARVTVVRGGGGDATLTARGIEADEQPPDTLVAILQAANREVRARAALDRAGLDRRAAAQALSPPPLAVRTTKPVDDTREKRSGFAFFAALLLYGQLIGLGFLVASGVVEEKASRVVEVLLATLRPRQLLAGKVIGLGLLGLAQLLLIAVLGLAIAAAAGALEIDRDLVIAAALALGWFVVGYVFYAAAFACAGALVPRQEELQSVTTPLTLVLMVSFFLSFAVLDDPTGTLATVSSFLPPAAPMTMPARIALGAAPAWEIVAAFVLTLAAAAALIPLAGRIYSGAVLRTGATVKLRDAWRAAPRRSRTATRRVT